MPTYVRCLSPTILLLACVVFVGCSSKKSHEDHLDDIREYIADNGYDATETESGLFYSILEEGSGALPNENSFVRVVYKGYLLDGNVFDEYKTSEGLRLNVMNVIAGWQEGLLHFRVGSKGKLFIPPDLGYGQNRTGSIPPNSVLIFDITLVSVQ